MVNSTKLVTIKCGQDTADVSVCPEDFHLAELESWVRGRFQLSSNDRILYKDGDGNGMGDLIGAKLHQLNC